MRPSFSSSGSHPSAPRRARAGGASVSALLAAIALVALCVLLVRCGGGGGEVRQGDLSATGAVEPLLARATLERVGDVGLVEPTSEEGLGSRSLGGWFHLTENFHARDSVHSTHGVGNVRLTAGQPRDRRVEIDLIRSRGNFESADPAPVSAELGGETFDLGELTTEWQTFAFDAPAELWSEGDNRLSIIVENQRKMATELMGMAAVRVVDAERGNIVLPDPSDEGINLASAEAARFTAAGIDGALLTVECRSEGNGELLVHMQSINPSSGVTSNELIVDEVLYVGPDRPAEATIELPLDAPPLVQLELRWQPEDGESHAELLRADLQRGESKAPKLVVFLSVDTLTSLNMSLHGYERPTTPFLEGLAAESIVFDRAVTNCPWTLPSYISQFTAMLPNAHRRPNVELLEDASTWSKFQLASNRLTLAEMFNAAGYQTAGIIDNPFLAQLRGLRQGFERLDVSPTRRPLVDTDGGMVQIAETALEWIDDWDRDRPLFLFMQVLDVHGPYVSVAPWKDTFADPENPAGPLRPVADSMEVALGGVPEYVADGLWAQGFEKGSHVPVGLIRDHYDEKILEMDARVKDFLEQLEARGLRDDTLFVLSADHGEITTQHEIYFRHGPVLEPSIAIPLIIDPPGQTDGRRVPDPVSLVDLMPTLADLIGLDPAPFAFHGRSLKPLMEGREMKEFPIAVHTTHREERAIIYDNWKLVHSEPGFTSHLSTVLTYDLYWDIWAAKFPEWAQELAGRTDLEDPPAYDRQRFETFHERNPDAIKELRRYFRTLPPFISLYDLTNDPGELVNVADREPERVERMLKILEASDKLTNDARLLANVDELVDEMTPAMLEELESLGYISGDDD